MLFGKGAIVRAALGVGVLGCALGGPAAIAVAVEPVQAAAPVTRAASHIVYMPTLSATRAARAAANAVRGTAEEDCVLPIIIAVDCQSAGQPMTYGGGPIQQSIKVYIVRWGWTSDPSGEAAYQERFFSGVGGSKWANSQTQYCNSTTILGLVCTATARHVGNNTGVWNSTRSWDDTATPVPSSPTDADIQAEAARAAAHFGNTTKALNTGVQYIIDTPHGKSTNGFNTSWCAYHGWSTAYGGLSYTDFPYQTDAGANCGANFVNSGSAGLLDGVSIVGGHEWSESATDPNPPTGWTDEIGAENGDKCAWIFIGQGSIQNVSLSSGRFAVQSLWSNNANNGAGGCSIYYASPSNQH